LLPRLGLPSGSTSGAGTTCAPFPAIVAVDVRGATGEETTANGVETSLPSAIPGHARMLHLALAPTRLTLDQSVRLLGRRGLTSIQLVRRLRCSSAADYASALSLRQVFRPIAGGYPSPCACLPRARLLPRQARLEGGYDNDNISEDDGGDGNRIENSQ
jgi:hypothetical protein